MTSLVHNAVLTACLLYYVQKPMPEDRQITCVDVNVDMCLLTAAAVPGAG